MIAKYYEDGDKISANKIAYKHIFANVLTELIGVVG